MAYSQVLVCQVYRYYIQRSIRLFETIGKAIMITHTFCYSIGNLILFTISESITIHIKLCKMSNSCLLPQYNTNNSCFNIEHVYPELQN